MNSHIASLAPSREGREGKIPQAFQQLWPGLQPETKKMLDLVMSDLFSIYFHAGGNNGEILISWNCV